MAKKTLDVVKNYSNLNRRLSELMKEKGTTIHALSKTAGIAVGTIQKLITDPLCNPTISSMEAICSALDISIAELIGQEKKTNGHKGPGVYLINWEDVQITPHYTQRLSQNNLKSLEIIKTSCPVSGNAFALKMRDSSMLPLFPENSILIFDPEKKPMDNNYVIVKMHNHRNIIFNQLLINEPYKYIRSINPIFKENIIKLEQTDKIIAVLVQSQMQYLN